MKEPTSNQIATLQEILEEATHRNVADALLKGFLWACYPEWYEYWYKQAWKNKYGSLSTERNQG